MIQLIAALAIGQSYLEPAEVKVDKTQAVLTYRLPAEPNVYEFWFWGPPPSKLTVQTGKREATTAGADRFGHYKTYNFPSEPITVVATFADVEYQHFQTLIMKYVATPIPKQEQDDWLFRQKAWESGLIDGMQTLEKGGIAIVLKDQTAIPRIRQLLIQHPGPNYVEFLTALPPPKD